MSDDPKRRGLGRGLSALFGEEPAAPVVVPPAASPVSPPPRATLALPIEKLRPGRYQPRRNFDDAALDALVESVRAQGVLQPLLVRRSPDDGELYEILAGERRWRAAQRAQLHEVPVVLREMSDREALEIALVENIQRQDLTAIEEAAGYQRLIDEFGHTQEALGLAVGKSRSHIANTLRLLQLPAEVRAMLDDGRLTAGHARALLTARQPLVIAQAVLRGGLNVRQTESLVKAEHPAKDTKRAPRPQKSADIAALEHELTTHLGLKVGLSFDGKGGRLAIDYRSLDQLDSVLKKLRG